MSTAAEEVGAENFFAQDSKLDLANVCSEVNTEAKASIEKDPEYDDIGSDGTEDPAMVEKVIWRPFICANNEKNYIFCHELMYVNQKKSCKAETFQLSNTIHM